MALNEMKAKPALPERVRSMEGLGTIGGSIVEHLVDEIETQGRGLLLVLKVQLNVFDFDPIAAARQFCLKVQVVEQATVRELLSTALKNEVALDDFIGAESDRKKKIVAL